MAPNVVSKRKNNRWTSREKKTLLAVLREYGHKNIAKIAQYLPTRTEREIASYLRKHEQSALQKFKTKKRLQVQESFSHIHPWMSFVNVHCNSQAKVHDHLVAYMLPIFAKYGHHPSAKFGGIDFKIAYRALFSALTMQKFPDDLNHETFSMIYASMKLLLKETSNTKDESYKNVLAKCLERHFVGTSSRTNKVNEEKDTMELPEVNVLQLTSEELNELCEVKD